MKKRLVLLFLICCISLSIFAQQQRFKIAVFVPLYLDSAFKSTGGFTSGKNFPKYVNAGLDFYLGAQAAVDSLQKRYAPLEVFIYDIKAKNFLSNGRPFPAFDLVIAHSNAAETRQLSIWSSATKTPFISATLPNDVGVKNNPYFVMLNSSLEAHLESIHQFISKNYGQQKITVFTKAGANEEQIKRTLQNISKQTGSRPLNLKFVDVGSEFTASTLAGHLDSTQKNIVIGGSLQESFTHRLVQNLSVLNKNYPIAVIGMPTWENLNFSKAAPNLEIFYSTPFNIYRNSALESKLTSDYVSKTGSKPGDLYFRGYETMLRFSLLLLDTRGELASELTRKGNTVFTSFNIQPVFKDRSNMTLDYFENKNFYFIRTMGGSKSIYSW